MAIHADDHYVMYYTAAPSGSNAQAIGRAVATRPEGPYRDESDEPLIWQVDEGGSIDASPFQDSDGRRYLLWKNDGNAVGQDTWIYAQEMDATGTTLQGEAVRLMKNDQPWEGAVVEGPYLLARSGVLHLFYSGNAVASDRYAVGHAICETPLGPCHKPAREPILSGNDVATAPGHCVVIEHKGRTWMVHHAWRPGDIETRAHGRAMWLTEITWDGDTPVCHGPTKSVDSTP